MDEVALVPANNTPQADQKKQIAGSLDEQKSTQEGSRNPTRLESWYWVAGIVGCIVAVIALASELARWPDQGAPQGDVGATTNSGATDDQPAEIARGGLLVDKPAWGGVDDGARYLGDRLRQGDVMKPGDYIASKNLMAVLYMQPDGNVVLAAFRRLIWETGTTDLDVAHIGLEDNGNLVVRSADGEAIWDPWSLPEDQRSLEPNAYESATSTAELVIQNDGNLVAYNSSNPARDGAWWDTETNGTTHEPLLITEAELSAGMSLEPNEYIRNIETSTPHALVFQDDGNLVLYEPGKIVDWDSNTDGIDVARVVVREDGDVVWESEAGDTALHTATAGYPDAYLRLGGDGNLVVYERVPGGDDRPIWSRNKNELVRP